MTTARRLHELLEPICLVTYLATEVDEALAALGHPSSWDGYFAARAAPLGWVPAEVVHAAFYSFAEGEAARHIPSAWETIPPGASLAARERGSVAALRRIVGAELADGPGLVRAADLTTKAATSAPIEGRVMYAGMRTLPVPGEPVARLWHAATMLREHRGDGHVAALVGARIGGTEAHVLSAVDMGIDPPESFGRLHHLPQRRLAAVMDGLRERGLLDGRRARADQRGAGGRRVAVSRSRLLGLEDSGMDHAEASGGHHGPELGLAARTTRSSRPRRGRRVRNDPCWCGRGPR